MHITSAIVYVYVCDTSECVNCLKSLLTMCRLCTLTWTFRKWAKIAYQIRKDLCPYNFLRLVSNLPTITLKRWPNRQQQKGTHTCTNRQMYNDGTKPWWPNYLFIMCRGKIINCVVKGIKITRFRGLGIIESSQFYQIVEGDEKVITDNEDYYSSKLSWNCWKSQIENFCDKNSWLPHFFVITTALQHPCGQLTLSLCPQLHVARHWHNTLHANMKRKKLDKTYTGLSFYPSAVVCLAISSTWLLADSIQDEGSESHNFVTLQRLHLLPSRKILAELSEVLKPKKKETGRLSE